MGYGATFSASTPDAAGVAKVLLIAPAAVTHANDMNQRAIEMTFTAGAGTLSVTSPRDATLAPPGYYMMFLLNDRRRAVGRPLDPPRPRPPRPRPSPRRRRRRRRPRRRRAPTASPAPAPAAPRSKRTSARAGDATRDQRSPRIRISRPHLGVGRAHAVVSLFLTANERMVARVRLARRAAPGGGRGAVAAEWRLAARATTAARANRPARVRLSIPMPRRWSAAGFRLTVAVRDQSGNTAVVRRQIILRRGHEPNVLIRRLAVRR